MIEVFMPKLGPSIEQATVVRWHKSQGETVRQGELILEIETEKTVQEVEAEAEGVLLEILVPEGQSCPVGTVLALLGAPGEALASTPKAVAQAPAVAIAEVAAPNQALAHEQDIDRVLIKASPAARRVAREKGVDLSTVSGTGPRGRIVSNDVLRAATAAEVLVTAARHDVPVAREAVQTAREGPVAALPIAGCGVKERRPLSSVRRVIAERMVHSKLSAPHFYISMDVDMTRVKETRQAWKDAGELPVPSFNDFILWATARALRSFPELNASLVGDEVAIYSDINIGMATAVLDGLLVPVISRADRMSVRGVASQSRDLAGRARDKKLLPSDCESGTFTVSNLGMFGVDNFVAIINPPQCAILAVGQVVPRVVTDGTSISICTQTTLTVSIDHRIADGVLASRFLGAVKEALEAYRDGD